MTMDVERIAKHSPMGGPSDWEFAERSVRSYCEVLRSFGLKATLFIVPDTADKQSHLFQSLAVETGAELGMHMHPQCWRDNYLEPIDTSIWVVTLVRTRNAFWVREQANGKLPPVSDRRPSGAGTVRRMTRPSER